MFHCNDNQEQYLDCFIKNIPIEPDTDYCLTVEQYGGAFGIWINKFFAATGFGAYYFDHCDHWTTHTLHFTTGSHPAKAPIFGNWGISLFKKMNSLYVTGIQDTYLSNIRLFKCHEPKKNLLADTSLVDSQTKHKIQSVDDPLRKGNRCLLLTKLLSAPEYPDHITLRADGFGWYKNETNHSHHRDPIGLPYHLLLLVEQGDVKLLSEQPPRTISAGNVIYIPPNTPIHYRGPRGKSSGFYWVMFNGETADHLLQSITKVTATTIPLPRFSTLTTHIDQMLQFPTDNALYPYALSAHLQLLLAELGEQLVPKAEDVHRLLIDRIAGRMLEQPEQPIDNARLAEECGFSVGHFIRLFKQYKGYTPHQYHLRALAQKAAVLLCDTTMSVQEISFSLGIENPLYFSRLFRSIHGMPPKEYRKRKLK